MPIARHWQRRINAFLAGQFEVLAEIKREPAVHALGRRTSPPEEAARATEIAKQLNRDGRPNDPHGIVVEEPAWLSAPLKLAIEVCDFATVSAMRAAGGRPAVLSASNLVVCPALGEIVLNKRAPDLATFPGCLHSFGGAYLPPGGGAGSADRGLGDTAQRETMEESRIALRLDNAAIVAAREIETGFVQIAFLGAATGPSQLANASGNWEGKEIVRVGFADLEPALARRDWCPSGKGHVLAWLALGAPNAPPGASFGRLSPAELFDKLVP